MLLLSAFLVLTLFVTFYLYIKKCHSYWKEKRIPTVKPNSFLGTFYDFIIGRASAEEVFDCIYASFPNEPYVGIYRGWMPVLFLRDPDLINQIMARDFSHFHEREKGLKDTGRLSVSVVELEGEEWKTVRNKLLPSFSGNKMQKMYNLIEECTDMLVEGHFRSYAKTGEPMEIKEAMARFSLDTIGKCAFGLQFDTMKESDNIYRNIGKTFADNGFASTVRMFITMMCPNLVKWFGIKKTSTKVENFFFDLLHQSQELRNKELEHRGDFLQLMLDIKRAQNDQTKHLFTDDHIASNMFVFYMAGHETTALLMSFALYELTVNPEIQEKLREEVIRAREANGGILDYTTVKKIPYLEMVVSETLRLHAPAPTGSRICTQTYVLPGSSLKFKPGDQIVYPIAAIHKDEKYFPNPSKFDPERFSEENVAQRNPNAYMPWGSGPRICLGMRFAKLEIKMCLAHVLLRFRLAKCAKTEEPPLALKKKGFFHSPENEIWVSVEEI